MFPFPLDCAVNQPYAKTDCKADQRARENVRREMHAEIDAGKGNERRKNQERPALLFIVEKKNRARGKGGAGMTGREG